MSERDDRAQPPTRTDPLDATCRACPAWIAARGPFAMTPRGSGPTATSPVGRRTASRSASSADAPSCHDRSGSRAHGSRTALTRIARERPRRGGVGARAVAAGSPAGRSTCGVGTEPEQQAFEPRGLADREHDVEARRRGALGRPTRPGTPRRPRPPPARAERDARVVGARACRPRRDPNSSSARLEVLAGRRAARGCGRRGTCARPSARWQYASTYHSPSAKNTTSGSMRRVVSSSRPADQ